MDANGEARIVLVHDWLTGMRGGEKCLEPVCRRWPRAPLFTLLHKPGAIESVIEDRPIRTSFLQALPEVHRYYRWLLPLMPAAARSWRLPACDLVVSFSHCVAKSALPPRGVPHVCYCFTPMRYAWHMRDAYFADRARGIKARLLDDLLSRLRQWDRQTSERVSHFVAISKTVQTRIAECYGRDSTVIYPPVDTEFYRPDHRARDDYYLVVSACAPYKRIDLAIEACRQMKRKLVVIGAGQDQHRLKRLAGGGDVQFLGWQPNTLIRDHFRTCKALLFPGEEDFGIVPLEAQACGTPVVAFGRGGATETVIPPGGRREPTGHLFAEQTADAFAEALERFERQRNDFSPMTARRQAMRFNARRFEDELFAYLDGVVRGPTAVALRRAA